MIYEDFIKLYSYEDYTENKEQILPESIVFNAEEGNEKLITQNTEFDFVPSGGQEGQILQKTEDGYKWTYGRSMKKVTSLNNLPIIYSLVIAEISSNTDLTTADIPVEGQEIAIIVKNTSSSSITITIPNGEQYVNFGADILTVEAGKYAEINLLSDGENIYIRSI